MLDCCCWDLSIQAQEHSFGQVLLCVAKVLSSSDRELQWYSK